MPNRRVLIVAYYFPPINSAGSFRPLKFARYLPEFGWDPIVLCAQPTPYEHLDEGLLGELSPSAIVERVTCLHPRQIEQGILAVWTVLWKLRLRRLAMHLEPYKVLRWLPPDPFVTWVRPALRAAQRLVRQYQPQVILTSTPPHSGQLIGLQLKRTVGLPWVADFRDPWSQNPFQQAPTSWHTGRIRRWEQEVLRLADVVVAVTAEATAQMRALGEGNHADKFVTIPNGFDAADFAAFPAAPSSPDGKLHVAYIGSLYGIRRADAFLAAVAHLVESGAVAAEKLLVEFIGQDGTGVAARYADRPWFRHTPPQPHRQALQTMRAADLLLLLIPSGASYMHPSKLFEYLAARRPILALAPPHGEVAHIVLAARAGLVAPPDDEQAIAAAFLDAYRSWEAGQLHIEPDLEVVNGFERRRLTARLAALFDQLAAQ
jgi:glycosyltransferase involved in cell wall biosynthesis